MNWTENEQSGKAVDCDACEDFIQTGKPHVDDHPWKKKVITYMIWFLEGLWQAFNMTYVREKILQSINRVVGLTTIFRQETDYKTL